MGNQDLSWILALLDEEERKKKLQQQAVLRGLLASVPKSTPSLKESKDRIVQTLKSSNDGEITKGRELPEPEDLGLADGRKLHAAILYSDLRGFSQIVSQHPRRSVLLALDAYVSEMTRIASDFNGTVVDCAGDRIMAVFHRPYGNADIKCIYQVVTCAFWMQTVVKQILSPILQNLKLPGVDCGIGVDYGDVVVARVGIRSRNKLVFLGNAANWAAKLEGVADPGQTNLSLAVYDKRPNFMSAKNGWIFYGKPNPLQPSWYSCDSIFANESAPSV